MKSFRDYKVWERAHDLCLSVYRETERFPRHEMFGLTNQMRRSSSSVPTNIAEGSIMGDAQFYRFLTIALGSAAELEYQLLLARDLGYIHVDAYPALNKEVNIVKSQLIRLRATIRRQPGSQSRQHVSTETDLLESAQPKA